MLVIPAIDLRNGRCVRLLQGDFDRETIYDDDPVRVARHWIELGAPWLHVVDLDGARDGAPAQLELVSRITALGGQVELGGGLRSMNDIQAALKIGIGRVIIGTAAVEDDQVLREAIDQFGPDRVVLGVDARNGRVSTRGWTVDEAVSADEVIRRAMDAGITRVIYTDIDRDGTLTSPNFGAIAGVAEIGIGVIASGGVSRQTDLEQLAAIQGVEGAIVGKALYERTVPIVDSAGWWISSVDDGGEAEEDNVRQK